MDHLIVRLLPEALDSIAAFREFSEGAADGAIVTFTGKVRGVDKAGQDVDHLYLDWYPGMTEASMEAIAHAACARFHVARVMVLHRCGQVQAGEDIVFVAAASAHRRAAFEAADYMMDRLKSEAAFWKREQGAGAERWIEPTAADQADRKRWEDG
ncbi:molybdenum cofactor biosynthesis protein MoaE [Asticcacaulis sp. SL142]|uniref:molybdenum cofactor biosynthesis protein MoaE n=1 Tax=Asticcacaulis sp. SL142 TaxID=2995155 RepID=UPI00226D1C1A|nr:molybdenum cofactor biosynthesis protein MoaE [Asticcacaulis sp. SL142]WAC46763.1 molybdenum cofactor biosynthesis protein MoaE [Asticcacaulis sp. SL142]